MKNKLFDELPKTVKLSTEKWLYILPNKGEGYLLYDPLKGKEMGRILFDDTDNWVYDGNLLSVEEQEEAAGTVSGYQKEMDDLFNTLNR